MNFAGTPEDSNGLYARPHMESVWQVITMIDLAEGKK